MDIILRDEKGRFKKGFISVTKKIIGKDKLIDLSLDKKKSVRWQENDIEFLRNNINKMSNSELSKSLSKSINSIANKLNELKIRRGQANIPINKVEEQIILGSILGDASILYKKDSTNPCFRESHSIKQKEYLLWKFRLIKSLNIHIFESTRKNGIKEINMASNQYHNFKLYRNLFYPNNKKIVNEEILKLIDVLGLAVWFLDDGHYIYPQKSISIATLGFSKEENEIIIKWFKIKWKIDCRLWRDKDKYRLLFNATNTNKFLRLIVPELEKHNLPNSMKYKFGHLHESNLTKIFEAIRKKNLRRRNEINRKKDRIRQRLWRAKNPSYIRDYMRKYRENPINRKRINTNWRKNYYKNKKIVG